MIPPKLFQQLVLLSGFMWLCMPPVRAQGATAQQKPTQLISFVMVGGKEYFAQGDSFDLGAEFSFRTGSEVHQLKLLPGSVAGPFARPAGDLVQVYRELPSSDSKLPPQVVPVAETRFSADFRNVIILVAAPESGKVQLHALSQDLKSLPEGHVGFVNFTPNEATVKFGTSQATIPAMGRANLASGLPGKAAAMVELQVAMMINGEWKLANSISIGFDPASRRLALLSPGETVPVRITLLEATPPDPKDGLGR
jgi:hypothetical protein